jgi:hypothetical protein
LINPNQLAQDEKLNLQALLQIVLDQFSIIKIPFLNNTITLRPLESSMNHDNNPIINSNYISTLMKVEVTDANNNT